jgi:hypothetical protein
MMAKPSFAYLEKSMERPNIDSVRFTRFSKLEDSIVKAEGGYSFTSNHEGELAGVWKEYVLKPGRYTFELVAKPLSNGRILVKCFIQAHSEKEQTFIGGLEFPGKIASLERDTAAFYEIVGRNTDGIQRLSERERSELIVPKIKFKISCLTIDDVVMDPTAIWVDHFAKAPQKAYVEYVGKKNGEYLTIRSENAEFPRNEYVLNKAKNHDFLQDDPARKKDVFLYSRTLKNDPETEK